MLYSTANFETNLEKFRTVGGKLTSDVSDSSFISITILCIINHWKS